MNVKVADAFVDDEIRQTPALIKQEIPLPTLRARFEQQVAQDWNLTHDEEFGKRFSARCPVSGAVPSDYNYKVIQLESGRFIMASIRFKHLNPMKPFVEIVHKDFPVTRSADLAEIEYAIETYYRTFSPLSVRLFDFRSEIRKIASNREVACDFEYFGAAATDIIAQEADETGSRIGLIKPTSLSFYKDYCAIYQELAQMSPLFGPEAVWFESVESLEGALLEGSLFCVLVDGEWAGIFALRRGTERFLKGAYFVEEVLRAKFRGKGLAADIQRRVIQSMQFEKDDFVYGHIMQQNIPAVRTAKRVGRRPLGGMYFVGLSRS